MLDDEWLSRLHGLVGERRVEYSSFASMLDLVDGAPSVGRHSKILGPGLVKCAFLDI